MYPYGQYAFYEEILFDDVKCKKISYFYKKCIRPTSSTLSYMKEKMRDLNIDEKTLGVLCRGTDYLNRKPQNHPRQPEPSLVIEDAKKIIKDNNYTKVFVATEDEQVLRLFKDAFGDQLRYIDQTRITLTPNQQYISDINTDINVKIKMALDYYTAIYILSKCAAIIGGSTAGTMGAVLMSSGFKHTHFYNLGHYE